MNLLIDGKILYPGTGYNPVVKIRVDQIFKKFWMAAGLDIKQRPSWAFLSERIIWADEKYG